MEEEDPFKLPINDGEVNRDINSDFRNSTAFLDREKEIEAFDNNLPKTVTLLRGDNGSKLYLIGTAHFSHESQNDVSTVIQAVRPNVVVVELCKSRSLILQMDEETILQEAKNLSMDKIMKTIKENGVLQGLIYILLLNMTSQLTQDLGMAPGGEFRRAFEEVKKLPGCLLYFGDRPVQISLKRVLMFLSWWKIIRLSYALMFKNEKMSQEEVEKSKDSDVLESLIEDLIEDYPELGRVFLIERDIYLTYSLQMATQHLFFTEEGEKVPTIAVGIVGLGHTPGIKERWGKVRESDIPPIMEIEKPQGIRWGRGLLFGAAALVLWHVAKKPSFTQLRSFFWRSA